MAHTDAMQPKISFSEFCRNLEVSIEKPYYKWFQCLFSDGPEQEKIMKWCYKDNKIPVDFDADTLMYHFYGEDLSNISKLEQWEERLFIVCDWFFENENRFYHKPWEFASSSKRKAHANRITRLANELAAAIEEDIHPPFFPVNHYFDEDHPNFRKQQCFSYEPDNLEIQTVIYKFSGIYQHRILFTIDKAFPQILRLLARRTQNKLKIPARDTRPNTGNVDARIFAKYLARQFISTFNRIPNDVIAACVCLKYPDIDPPPNA